MRTMPDDGSRRRSGRARHLAGALMAACLSVSGLGCGDDPSDAPVGSAPSSPSASSPSPAASGPSNSGQLSPEAQDEGHPSTPGEIDTGTTTGG